MKFVIKELEDVIKYHEERKDEQIAFLQSDKFKDNIQEPVEENVKNVINHTNIIYDQFIGEFKKAIKFLERCKNSRRKQHIRKRIGK